MKKIETQDYEILKDFKRRLTEGGSVLLENESLALAADSSAAIVISDKEIYSVKSPTSPQSGLLSMLTAFIGEGASIGIKDGSRQKIVEILKSKSTLYSYDVIKEELRKEFIIRGVNKIFNKLRRESIDYAIEAAALLEAFTGEAITVPETKVQQFMIFGGEKISPYYALNKKAFDERKTSDAKYSITEFTLRSAIEYEKATINPDTKGFEKAILLWLEWPSPVSVSQRLFEISDDNTHPEEKLLALPILEDSSMPAIVDQGLESDFIELRLAHKTAIYAVLARLFRKVPCNTFWVIKGKPKEDIVSLAEEEKAYIIDTETIDALTERKLTKKQLQAVKAALWDLPFIDLWIRFEEKSPISRIRTQIVFRQEFEFKDTSKVLVIWLPQNLWGDERRVLMEPWTFPCLHSLPHNMQDGASKLLDAISANHRREKNSSRYAFIALAKAADCIGYSSWLNNRQKSDVIDKINGYWDALQDRGAIESWELQSNGAYKVTLGV